MAHLMSIDLGTSSVKVLVIDSTGRILARVAREYAVEVPQAGYAEQHPADWQTAIIAAVREALAACPPLDLRGIGLSGQMHGTVLVDGAGQPLRPAVIWPDQRTRQEVNDIIEQFGTGALATITGTLPATGFMIATLLWLARHEPRTLDEAAHVLPPKDAIGAWLTGEFYAEISDASATGLFDVRRRDWSEEIIGGLGLPRGIFPAMRDSADVIGQLRPDAAEALGLPAGTPVVAGSADQVSQAVGNNLLKPGAAAVTIGTGGQVFAPLAAPRATPHLHTFCHAPADRWYMLGAMLSAGMSLRWLRDTLGLHEEQDAYAIFSQEAAEVPPGADGLLFLPYLAGERAPLMDPAASGVFIGLTLGHSRAHLARAIMEGVCFALRQIIEVMGEQDVNPAYFQASGNGLGSPVWRRALTDILGLPLRFSTDSVEHTALGAALIAGVGVGLYDGYDSLAEITARPYTLTEPHHQPIYDDLYALYSETYERLAPVMHALKHL